jgi:hypothetical protein
MNPNHILDAQDQLFGHSPHRFSELVDTVQLPIFAVTIPPYVISQYITTGNTNLSYKERFNSTPGTTQTCWELKAGEEHEKLNNVTLQRIWSDSHNQLTKLSFNEWRVFAGDRHVKEHWSHGLLMALFMMVYNIHIMVCKPSMGPDIVLDTVPCELKCARAYRKTCSKDPTGHIMEKDWINLRSARVRMLIVTQQHFETDTPYPGAHLELLVIPSYCIRGSKHRIRLMESIEFWAHTNATPYPHSPPLFQYEIHEENYRNIDALAPFRLRIDDDVFGVDLRDRLNHAYPYDERRWDLHTNPGRIQAFVEPNWAQLNDPKVFLPFLGMDPQQDDISGELQKPLTECIRDFVAKSRKYMNDQLQLDDPKIAPHLRRNLEWPYRTHDVDDNGNPLQCTWSIPSGKDVSPAYHAKYEAKRVSYPRNPNVQCPGPGHADSNPTKLFGPDGVTLLPMREDGRLQHRHANFPDLKACLKHIAPGKNTHGAGNWWLFEDGTYVPTTSRFLKKWKLEHESVPCSLCTSQSDAIIQTTASESSVATNSEN